MSSTLKTIPTLLAVLVLAAFATIVLGQEPAETQSQPKDWQKAAASPPVIPKEEQQRENPYAWDAEARKKGKLYFASQCVMCHGAEGRGDGDLVARLKLTTIPDFSDPQFHKKWTDGSLYYVIETGHGAMPSQKQRFDPEIKWGMVNYVRSLAQNP